MFLEESRKICNILAKLKLDERSRVFDIGSSTEEYRCLFQPHIDYYVFRPLRERNAVVIHIDKRRGKGVDLVCDLTDPESLEFIKTIKPADVILCCSLLEHVVDRQLVINRIKDLTKQEGIIIVSVPYVFPYHEDPIDTMYRPSSTELEKLFSKDEFTILDSIIIDITSQPLDYRIDPFNLFGSSNLYIRIIQKILTVIGKILKKIVMIPCKFSIVVVKKK